MSDIQWAESVLKGNGLSVDCQHAATAVLSVLVEHGATEEIRKRADKLLCPPPPSPLVVVA